jgi:uncharacterized membrane protein
MERENFWRGFGLGALAGAAGFVIASGRASSYDSRILRLERSIQIGRPVTEVFAEWSNFAELPQKISALRRVDVSGLHSTWVLEVDRRRLEFAAEIAQLIPNQAIGWKSITGPKHSGRIHFAQLGHDTLVHVTMNYAPPLGRFGRLLAPITDHLESQIEQALREFKRALEEGSITNTHGGVVPASTGGNATPQNATGTEGVASWNPPSRRIEDRTGR